MNPVNSKSSTLVVAAMLLGSSSAFALPTGIPIGMMEMLARIASAPNPNEVRAQDVSSVSQWMNPFLMTPQLSADPAVIGASQFGMKEGHSFTLPVFSVAQYSPVYKMGAEPFQNSPVFPGFAGGAR